MSKFTIDSKDLITRNVIVKGEVYISGYLGIMDRKTLEYAEKTVDNSAGTITVTGNLYIQCNEMLVKEAIAYYDMKLSRDETFDENHTINNVIITTDRFLMCGKLKSEGDITYCSTIVHNKVKREKINKIITNIKKQKTYV
jgi:hypothetical protein